LQCDAHDAPRDNARLRRRAIDPLWLWSVDRACRFKQSRWTVAAGPLDVAPDYKTQASALLVGDPVGIDTIGDNTVAPYYLAYY
jgi:hypothetical protein